MAENLFPRKQLALFQQRKVRPRRPGDSTRGMMAALSQWFAWRNVLENVQADTLRRWHRQGFRLFWRWKSKTAGRPRLPKNLQGLIREIEADNPRWAQERIANELQLKLGLRVSPRTVAFRILWRLVLMDVATRRILHHNVTAHPTADWTLQQFRETLPGDHPYRFVLHDRDSIFSQELDKAVTQLGVRVLRTPVRAPMANAFCERLGGSLRRECLDFLIPLHEGHPRMIVKEWGLHYNRGRPHSSLGPGIPEPSQETVPASDHRHKLPAGYRVGRTPVLGGLHHEYHLVKEAA